jgi:hypothetical protein
MMGSNNAVTEIIGVMLLLGISISLFSVVYYTVLTTELQENSPNVFVFGSIDEDNDLLIYHQGGESIDGQNTFQVEIGGINRPILRLKDYILDDVDNDDTWDFGEAISYPLDDIENVEVKINIYDRHSNSLILSSVVQKGYAISEFGIGAIWHFDEGSGPLVNDSSGNLNHGRVYGAEWTTGMNNSALEFDPFDEDYIEVADKSSLDISKNITLEAWIKPDPLSNLITETHFDDYFEYYPYLCHANDDIYALVFGKGSMHGGNCILKTVDIESTGEVQDASVEELIVDTSCYEPKVLKIAEGLVLVAYGNSIGQCHLKTYMIDDSGSITPTGQEYIQGTHCEEITLSQVADNVYAIAYGDDDEGYLFTIGISELGVIDSSEIDSVSINDKCADSALIQITDGLFILGYVGDDGDYLQSFTIDEFGEITDTGFTNEYFDESNDPDLVSVSEKYLAIVFEDDDENGIVKTYRVEEAGELIPTGSVLQFEGNECQNPDIMHLYNDVYAIAYEGPNFQQSRVARIRIQDDGEIDASYVVDVYDSDKGAEPYMMKISDYVTVFVYRQDTKPGGLSTFGHLADIKYPSYYAGIYKSGSYGIYANYTTAYGCINNKTISYSGITPGWMHLALVYNSSTICLYVNGFEVASMPYTGQIQRNDYTFFIGKAFSGKIDEVAIFDRALSPAQIEDHYQNPGELT